MTKSPTYKELIAELMPIYDADRARFMRFYDAVWLMLYNMAEGDKLVIADRCREADRQLFFKVACLIMISDMRGREYYFYDEEKTIIQRGRVFVPKKINRSKFYDKKRT